MMRRKIYKYFSILFLAISATGCTLGVGPYKTTDTLSDRFYCDESKNIELANSYLHSCTPREKNGAEADNNVVFGVVEFDDFGEFLLPDQANKVFEEIKKSAESRPTILSVFIHGWRHNASEGSSNLSNYRKLIHSFGGADCSPLFSTQKSCVKPNIVGVYVSWRGDPLGLTEHNPGKFLKIPQTLSFWNRWRASQKISNTNITHFLLKLAEKIDDGDKVRLKNHNIRSCILADYLGGEQQCSRKFVVGHSFGGRILEHTVAQAFIGNRSLANKMNLGGFLDQQYKRTKNIQLSIDRINATNDELLKQREKLNSLVSEHMEQQEGKVDIETDLKEHIAQLGSDIIKIPEANSYHSEFQGITNAMKFKIVAVASKSRTSICKSFKSLSEKYELTGSLLKHIEFLECGFLSKIDAEQEDSKYMKLRERRKILFSSCKFWVHYSSRGASAILNSHLEKDVENCRNSGLPLDIGSYSQLMDEFVSKYGTEVEILQIGNFANVGRYYESLNTFRKDSKLYLKRVSKAFARSSVKNIKVKTVFKNLDSYFTEKKIFLIQRGDGATATETKSFARHIKSFEKITEDLEYLQDQRREAQRKLDLRVLELSLITHKIESKEKAIKKIDKHVVDLVGTKAEQENVLVETAKEIEDLTYSIYEPPYNLALLLNPANGALSTSMLKGSMCDSEEYLAARKNLGIADRPWLIAISSIEDEATGLFYGLATEANIRKRVLQEKPVQFSRTSVFGGSCTSSSSQRELLITPAPFVEDLRTHKVSKPMSPNPACSDDYPVGNSEDTKMHVGIERGFLYAKAIEDKEECDEYLGDYNVINEVGKIVETKTLIHNNIDIQINENPRTFRKQDYWVFTVDPYLISDHNDIFNPSVGKLMAVMLRRNLPIGSRCRLRMPVNGKQGRASICSIVSSTALKVL